MIRIENYNKQDGTSNQFIISSTYFSIIFSCETKKKIQILKQHPNFIQILYLAKNYQITENTINICQRILLAT